MNLIKLLLEASWLQVAIAILTGLASGGCTARLIALINAAVGENFTDDLLWHFAGLAIAVLINSVVSQLLLIRLSQDAVYRLRLRLCEGILSSPLGQLEKLGVTKLMATLTDDVTTLSNSIYAIPFICVDIAIIIGCLLYLFLLSPRVFGFTIGFMMVGVGSIQLLINRAQVFLTLSRDEQDRLFKHFRGITEGIKELKLHLARRQAFLTEELQDSAKASRNYNISALSTFSISTGWGNLLFFTLIGLLLFVLPSLFNIKITVISGYILTVTYCLLPMQSILDKQQQLFRAIVALRKIDKMGLYFGGQKSDIDVTILPQFSQVEKFSRLELIDITHTYPGDVEDTHFTLGTINLTFHRGEVVFIVGGNGSGKSTFAKIITGLYIPEQGSIRLDAKVITDENREWYRQHFSVVFSDFYLFDRLLGVDNGDLDKQAKKYLEELQLDKKVQVKNGILSTTALSQGQRKRLALLTAYLEDRPIYLFDEWASDQDPLFRDIFYQEILMNLKQRGKTVFVISHDDHYFHLADRVIKLDYGQVEYDRCGS
jgi:putative pyoverdin transport system ATP-binding/permease protein